VHQKKLSPTLIAKVMDYNPAKIFGFWGRKGAFEIGFDADIVILDPAAERTISVKTQISKADYAPLEGMKLKGAIDQVYLRGEKVAEDGRVIKENRGQYLKRGLPEFF